MDLACCPLRARTPKQFRFSCRVLQAFASQCFPVFMDGFFRVMVKCVPKGFTKHQKTAKKDEQNKATSSSSSKSLREKRE